MSGLRSLVLVTVDCLRADHVGFMGYTGATAPFADALAAESTVMANAIVAGTPTYYSFPAIMASRYPLALGRSVIGLGPEEPTIASVLNQYGYNTAAFVAGNPYLARRFGYASGFDVYDDFLEDSRLKKDSTGKGSGRLRHANERLRRISESVGLRSLYDELYFRYGQRVAARSPKTLDQLRCFPSAEVIVGRAADWLQQRGEEPFFLWLHLMDPHGPYYPQQPALDLTGNNQMTANRARYLNSYWMRDGLSTARSRRRLNELVSLYDSGVRWVDQQLAGLVQVLRSLKRWNDCTFALTADHGEEFLDHGGRMHAPPKVTEEVVHVPLLIHFPGLPARRIETPFSLLHLAPTLLDSLALPIPGDFCGRSRWPMLKAGNEWDGEAIVECVKGCSNPLRKKDREGGRIMAVRAARYKLVLDLEAESDYLFDLQSDPRELRPLPPSEAKPVRRHLLERARRHIYESLNSRDPGRRAALVLHNIGRQAAEA